MLAGLVCGHVTSVCTVVQGESRRSTDRHCTDTQLTCVWNRPGYRQQPRHGHVRSEADGGLHEHVSGYTEEQETQIRSVCHQRGTN